MNLQERLERLLHKYYGYVADLEGSGIEILDLLFVRDDIQSILEESRPATEISSVLYNQVYQLDDLLWQQKNLFLQVIGEDELRHARGQQQSLRSHWWWYMDQIQLPIRPIEALLGQPSLSLIPAG